ncbi:MAG: EamA family transporter, partial [Gaiellaceae bacterium]
MLAILGGLGAALAWATTTLTAARASRLIDPWSLLASVMTVGFLVSAPAAAIAGMPTLDGGSVGWLVVSGGGNVVGLLFTYSALRIGKVGLVAPITSTEGAVAAAIAVIAGEQLRVGTGATLAVIACGVALAAASPADPAGRRNDLRAIVLAGCGALSFGFSLYATGRIGQDLGIAWAALPPRVVGVAAIALPLALT